MRRREKGKEGGWEEREREQGIWLQDEASTKWKNVQTEVMISVWSEMLHVKMRSK